MLAASAFPFFANCLPLWMEVRKCVNSHHCYEASLLHLSRLLYWDQSSFVPVIQSCPGPENSNAACAMCPLPLPSPSMHHSTGVRRHAHCYMKFSGTALRSKNERRIMPCYVQHAAAVIKDGLLIAYLATMIVFYLLADLGLLTSSSSSHQKSTAAFPASRNIDTNGLVM